MAGLEININLFRKAQTRSIIFGVITTIVPQVLGTVYGLAFAMRLFLASSSARYSHRTFYLVCRSSPALALLSSSRSLSRSVPRWYRTRCSLIVFGICVFNLHDRFFTSGLALQIVEVAIFVPLILIGVSRAGAWILSRLRNDETGFFVTMLGIMAVAGVLADQINVRDIVGAFLAGWAVNAAVGDHAAKEKLEFFGKALFVPIFFFVTGFLIVPGAVWRTFVDNFWLVAGMVVALILGKVAAAVAGYAFGYPRDARLPMWAMTVPLPSRSPRRWLAKTPLMLLGSGSWPRRFSMQCWCCWAGPDGVVRIRNGHGGGTHKGCGSLKVM